MKQLKLPSYSYNIRESSDGRTIFDPVRRKYVALTPEEWVRQHFLNYLVAHLGYPAGLIRVEAAFRLNSMVRRSDILVCDRSGKPAMIVECKAPEVRITQEVFDQVINYNLKYGAGYVVVTNGLSHYSAMIDNNLKSFTMLSHIPDYNTLNNSEL